MQQPLIVAHRTCPLQAPENSLEGIRQAAEQGADAVEIDLRVSLDQQPFLMHDNSMRRTTGFPLPVELTPAALVRRQRLSNGEPVPSLAQAMDALPGSMLIAVDVKTPWAILPLMREVERRGLGHRTLVWCESALAVRYAASRRSGAEVAYLRSDRDPAGKERFLRRARHLGADAVSVHWLALDAQFVARAHELGLRVYSFHESYPLTDDKLGAGLDGLITDHVVTARQAVAAVQRQV